MIPDRRCIYYSKLPKESEFMIQKLLLYNSVDLVIVLTFKPAKNHDTELSRINKV